jgi:hypothetical protein
VTLAYGPVRPASDGREYLQAFNSGPRSDAKGEFQLASLGPGKYAVVLFRYGEKQLDLYADPAAFEIAGADATGVELRTYPGASLSGTATIEGSDDPAAARDALVRLVLHAARRNEERDVIVATASSPGRFESDGSFRIVGLKPGEYRLGLNAWGAPKGYSLLRVEREGAEVSGRLALAAGEQITGLRVVIGYGTGMIRGQVTVENGSLPDGARLWVMWRRPGEEAMIGSAQTDARRQFLVEGLYPGEYQIEVAYFPQREGKPVRSTKLVSVSNGATAEVTIALDLAPKEEGETE